MTVLDDDSSDGKPLKTIKDSSLTDTKLSAVFLELRGELLKEQQQKETEVSYSEDQQVREEIAPTEIINQENPTIPSISLDLFPEDEGIFRKLDVP